ncbi:hypothetical protein H0H87_012443 [Tephrocybe sp. NHM501043]|nr:hypothetical protein H0H87_012443 [Tephrocybe sp. NHM501043]
MASGQRSFQVTSKFIALYAKFLDGLTPNQIAPREDHDQFFTNLFNLEVKKEYLRDEFSQLSKDSCLGKHKPFLNLLFRECLVHARSAPYDDVRKVHALETLSIVLRCILSKNPTGWEVMEILGGGVGQSDEAFMFIKSCNTEGIVSENALLLAILANFHKSEAARLNPYLKCLRTTTDTEVMHKICWATNTQLVISIQ